MNKEEYDELQEAMDIMNKYRNIWHTYDYKHEAISLEIDKFLPHLSCSIEKLVKDEMLSKLGEN